MDRIWRDWGWFGVRKEVEIKCGSVGYNKNINDHVRSIF